MITRTDLATRLRAYLDRCVPADRASVDASDEIVHDDDCRRYGCNHDEGES